MPSTRRVVVVGSGAAGATAAVAAATEGADVTLIEKAPLLGGTTSYSGGGIWIPANPWAEAEGDHDTIEEALTYVRNLGLGDMNLPLVERYAREGVRVVKATEAATPLRWNTIKGFPDYHAGFEGGKPGGGRSMEIEAVVAGREILSQIRPDPYGKVSPVSYFRIYANPREIAAGVDQAEIERREREGIVGKGVGLLAGLYLTARQLGVKIRTGLRVSKLLTSGDTIVGVEADGEQFDGQVIIATGGFDRDPALVKAFLRGPLTAPGSPPTNTGDGLRMGMTVGAELGSMSEAWWAPATSVPGMTIDGQPFYWQLLGPAGRAKPGGIIVDSRGRRYTDEAANYNDMGRAMHSFDASSFSFPAAHSWWIFDEESRRSDVVGPLQPNDPAPDWIAQAPSLSELALRIGVPGKTLHETMERFNSHAARGLDEDFGRGSDALDTYQSGGLSVPEQLRPITQGPFYAMPMEVGCLGTKGGLRIDGNGQVQRADGSGPIPGLYAAGNATASPFGAAYPSGGATIGPALVFGWIAGENAARG